MNPRHTQGVTCSVLFAFCSMSLPVSHLILSRTVGTLTAFRTSFEWLSICIVDLFLHCALTTLGRRSAVFTVSWPQHAKLTTSQPSAPHFVPVKVSVVPILPCNPCGLLLSSHVHKGHQKREAVILDRVSRAIPSDLRRVRVCAKFEFPHDWRVHWRCKYTVINNVFCLKHVTVLMQNDPMPVLDLHDSLQEGLRYDFSGRHARPQYLCPFWPKSYELFTVESSGIKGSSYITEPWSKVSLRAPPML